MFDGVSRCRHECKQFFQKIELEQVARMGELTLFDACAGSGAFSLAAERCGIRTLAFSEIDSYACALLKQHWPGVTNVGDIKTADIRGYCGIDIFTAGIPCQPFSVSGRKQGERDDRHLWPAMRTAIAACRPTWCVLENVTGIDGLGLASILSELDADGYGVQPFVIPAAAVGAYHRRPRIFLVAYANGKRRNKATLQPGVDCKALRETESERPWTVISRLGASGRVWLAPSSAFVGMADGAPDRSDAARLKMCGNAVHVRIAEIILRCIQATERQCA